MAASSRTLRFPRTAAQTAVAPAGDAGEPANQQRHDATGLGSGLLCHPHLCMPKISSTSCDQVILVNHLYGRSCGSAVLGRVRGPDGVRGDAAGGAGRELCILLRAAGDLPGLVRLGVVADAELAVFVVAPAPQGAAGAALVKGDCS